MTSRQRELIRFAISFLMANLTDALDFDGEEDAQPFDPPPTTEELDQLHTQFCKEQGHF